MQLSTSNLNQLFAAVALSIISVSQLAHSASDNISTAIAFHQFENVRKNTEMEHRMKSMVDHSKRFKSCNFEITTIYIGKTQAYSERLASRSADSFARRLTQMGVNEINIVTKPQGYVGLHERSNIYTLINSECSNEASITPKITDDCLDPRQVQPSVNRAVALTQSQSALPTAKADTIATRHSRF